MHSHEHACCSFNPLLIYMYKVDAMFFIDVDVYALLP